MKCVILAAGASRRLQPLTNKTPKCLLEIGGMTLLERTIRTIRGAGIREFAIVTGFEEAKIRSLVRKRFPRLNVTFVHNRRFRATNNAYSLFLAREFVGDAPLLLSDSDILFGAGLLDEIIENPHKPNRIAVRVTGMHDEEEIRVKINRWDHVVEIGKHVPLRYTYGESIGIEAFSAPATRRIFEILEQRIAGGTGKTEYYEAAFQQAAHEGMRIWAIDVSRFPAIEIDTKDDLERAQSIASTLDHG